MPTATRTKRPTSQVIASDPEEFEKSLSVEDGVVVASAPAKPTKLVKKATPKNKVVKSTASAPPTDAPKRKRGAPPGRRSTTEDLESRPPGHKGLVAVFYMVGDKHKWKIFGRNGRCVAISGADFSTFAPAVESVRIITGTKNDPIKDESGYQAIDLVD